METETLDKEESGDAIMFREFKVLAGPKKPTLDIPIVYTYRHIMVTAASYDRVYTQMVQERRMSNQYYKLYQKERSRRKDLEKKE